jgi:hypothetical protein
MVFSKMAVKQKTVNHVFAERPSQGAQHKLGQRYRRQEKPREKQHRCGQQIDVVFERRKLPFFGCCHFLLSPGFSPMKKFPTAELALFFKIICLECTN